jgi:predicted Zn-ribbon and HTH transcriptional regulator
MSQTDGNSYLCVNSRKAVFLDIIVSDLTLAVYDVRCNLNCKNNLLIIDTVRRIQKISNCWFDRLSLTPSLCSRCRERFENKFNASMQVS